MKETLVKLPELYIFALQDYLAGAGEAALGRAYELGRRAMSDGMGVLEVVALQQEALRKVLRPNLAHEEILDILKNVEIFFTESLSPFEMTHRGFREANIALHRLNEALEEQAKRIARALHDEAGQLLAAVHIALKQVAWDLPVSAREGLREIPKMLNQVEEQIRHLSHELRPTILDDLGLLPAIEFLAEGISTRTRIRIQVEGSTGGRLPVLIETALYRIAQEALNNVVKHAQATQVTISLERGTERISFIIRDNGIGFQWAEIMTKERERGFGLIGIRERLDALGGNLAIISAPGNGTQLRMTVPLES